MVNGDEYKAVEYADDNNNNKITGQLDGIIHHPKIKMYTLVLDRFYAIVNMM